MEIILKAASAEMETVVSNTSRASQLSSHCWAHQCQVA